MRGTLTHISQSDDLVGFSFARFNLVSWLETTRGASFALQDRCEIVWITKGEGRCRCGDVNFVFSAGTLFLFNQINPYFWDIQPHTECIIISFSTDFYTGREKARKTFSYFTQRKSLVWRFRPKQGELVTLSCIASKMEGEHLNLGTPASADIIRTYLKMFLKFLEKWYINPQKIISD